MEFFPWCNTEGTILIKSALPPTIYARYLRHADTVVSILSAKTVDHLIFETLTDGYREEIVSLLKYRRLARSLERLYGSPELTLILQDEENHARLFLDIARDLDFDFADLGEEALLEELKDLARSELKMAEEYEKLLRSGRITNERVRALLQRIAEDSKRHHQTLTELSGRLEAGFADHS